MVTKTREMAAERLVELELERTLGGDECPDLSRRVCDAFATRERAEARSGRARRWLAAAVVLLGGGAVVWTIASLAGEQSGARESAAQETRSVEDSEMDSPPTVVESLDALRSVSVDCRALHWIDPVFAPDALARLRELRNLHLEVRQSGVDAGATLSGDDAIRMAQRLPKLLRLRLDGVGSPIHLGLDALSVVPNVRRIELAGGVWSDELGGLRRLPGLTALEVCSDRLSDTDLAHVRALTGLRHLRLEAIAEIEPEQVRATIDALDHLQSLRLWDVCLDDSCIEAILARPSIVALELVVAHSTEAGLFSPIFAESRWRDLCLGYGGTLHREDLDALPRMKSLERLSLGGASTLLHHWAPPEEFWRVLRGMEWLRSIDFSLAYNIEPDDIERLAGMPLKRIVLQLPFGTFAEDLEIHFAELFPSLEKVELTGPARMGGRLDAAGGAFAGGGLQLGDPGMLPAADRKAIDDFQKLLKAVEAERRARGKAR